MMSTCPLSEKQIDSIIRSTHRINLWCGAVRSGKTYASLLKFMLLLKNGPPGNVMIIGVSRESLQRNVLIDLCEMIDCAPPPTKTNEMRLFGRNVYLIGAHDEGAVRKIQGSTLALAYVDELAVLPEPFLKMLLSRLSIDGAQLLATCNPEGPAHWLKREFVDRVDELDMVYFQFGLDDNPVLSEAYKNNLKKEYTGAWYNRLILGEWAVAQGLVYDTFDQDNIYTVEPNNPDFYVVGLDYGITNPTAAVLIAISPSQWPQMRVVDTFYYDSAEWGRALDDAELADDIAEWIDSYPISRIYLDPTASSLKICMRRRGMKVKEASNDILPGIRVVSKFIAGKNLVFHSSCRKLIEEIQTYSWDQKSSMRGQDKPVKRNDHLMDALRYGIFSAYPSGNFVQPDKDLSIEAIRKRAYGEEIGANGEIY